MTAVNDLFGAVGIHRGRWWNASFTHRVDRGTAEPSLHEQGIVPAAMATPRYAAGASP